MDLKRHLTNKPDSRAEKLTSHKNHFFADEVWHALTSSQSDTWRREYTTTDGIASAVQLVHDLCNPFILEKPANPYTLE